MKPEEVCSGTPLVYSNASPALSTGSSPITPAPRMRIGDAPVPRLQLHRFRAFVCDRDGVGPEEIIVLRRRAVGDKTRRHHDFDIAGHGAIHAKRYSDVFLRQRESQMRAKSSTVEVSSRTWRPLPLKTAGRKCQIA